MLLLHGCAFWHLKHCPLGSETFFTVWLWEEAEPTSSSEGKSAPGLGAKTQAGRHTTLHGTGRVMLVASTTGVHSPGCGGHLEAEGQGSGVSPHGASRRALQ